MKEGQMFLKNQLEILDVKWCNYFNKGLNGKFKLQNSYKELINGLENYIEIFQIKELT